MRIGLLLLVLLLVLLPQSGCMTSRQMLDQSVVTEQLHDGESRDEVRRVFGAPQKSEKGSNGEILDEYVLRFAPPGQNPGTWRTIEVRSLSVLYDGQRHVEKFAYHVGAIKTFIIGYNERWRTDLWVEPKAVNRIKRGATTKADLIELFGPPTVEGLNIRGQQIASWYYGEGKRGSRQGHEFSVLVNADSVVEDYAVHDQPDESVDWGTR